MSLQGVTDQKLDQLRLRCSVDDAKSHKAVLPLGSGGKGVQQPIWWWMIGFYKIKMMNYIYDLFEKRMRL